MPRAGETGGNRNKSAAGNVFYVTKVMDRKLQYPRSTLKRRVKCMRFGRSVNVLVLCISLWRSSRQSRYTPDNGPGSASSRQSSGRR